MSDTRQATVERRTGETAIRVRVALDGTGTGTIRTGIGFLDHMLTALSRHSLIDMDIEADGDLHVDGHHTTEDVGIVLGVAIREAVGSKRGIGRYGQALVPMDEVLVEAAIDFSGRAYLGWDVRFPAAKIGEMDTELFAEFFRAFAHNALLALHVRERAGGNAHHLAEGCFKAVARALRMAVAPDARLAGVVPSTKGAL